MILDHHLLSCLGAYLWRKSAVALLWLSLSYRNDGSKQVPWKKYVSPESDFSNTEIDWLWDLRCKISLEARFVQLLQSFLQDSNRCRHLFVGKARSAGHFAHLCARTILDDYMDSPNMKTWRYLMLFLLPHVGDTFSQGWLIVSMRCCQQYWIGVTLVNAQMIFINVSG